MLKERSNNEHPEEHRPLPGCYPRGRLTLPWLILVATEDSNRAFGFIYLFVLAVATASLVVWDRVFLTTEVNDG